MLDGSGACGTGGTGAPVAPGIPFMPPPGGAGIGNGVPGALEFGGNNGPPGGAGGANGGGRGAGAFTNYFSPGAVFSRVGAASPPPFFGSRRYGLARSP